MECFNRYADKSYRVLNSRPSFWKADFHTDLTLILHCIYKVMPLHLNINNKNTLLEKAAEYSWWNNPTEK